MIVTNAKVVTPLGEGVVQGAFQILDGHGNEIARGVGVRLPVNDVTKVEMQKSYCLTPHAHINGLWVFNESELG